MSGGKRRATWTVTGLMIVGLVGLCGAAAPESAQPSAWTQLTIYCVCVVAASTLGGVLPNLMKLTHTRLQIMMSLIGGLMLGVGMLHQLPHAVVLLTEAGMPRALDWSLGWMTIGLVSMFFLLRMFHFHNHDAFEDAPGPHGHDCGHDHDHSHDHDHAARQTHAHDHDHDHDAAHSHGHDHGGGPHATSWMGVAFGLSLHTLTDGLALAAHVEADTRHVAGLLLPGVGTFLGIALHKPLDSLSITSLMSAGGWSAKARHIVNFGYALLCPLGVLLFHLGMRTLTTQQNVFVGTALAFSAGVFVCIALSDLLPEVQFHSHDRGRLSLALVIGLVAAWAIGFLEPEHTHGPSQNEQPGGGHDHSHDHDH